MNWVVRADFSKDVTFECKTYLSKWIISYPGILILKGKIVLCGVSSNQAQLIKESTCSKTWFYMGGSE